MASAKAHFPGRAPIDAYGDGGFRFADMSHRGSLLIVPSGIYGWDVAAFDELTPERCAPFLAELKRPAFVLLGTGTEHRMPPEPVRKLFAEAGIGLEPMSTGAAARTYNVLLAEGRDFGAGLIAVD
ncbi:MAG: Mth938-like domain-containing protein [Hyphomicrobium sp.]|nr:Mth938-like domain-containing protein [Hyphomicrobium sp.]